MLIFLLFSDQISGGKEPLRGELPRGRGELPRGEGELPWGGSRAPPVEESQYKS